MKTLGNIIWFLLGGFEMAIVTFLQGLILCITVIFIPFGLQLFKLSGFYIWPRGKQVVATNPNAFKTVFVIPVHNSSACVVYWYFVVLIYINYAISDFKIIIVNI